jgi:hypothetical protein
MYYLKNILAVLTGLAITFTLVSIAVGVVGSLFFAKKYGKL